MFDEKYQPRSLRENIGNASPIFKLLNFFKDNIISSILIYGPSNSGKIEMIKGLCHQFFGKYEKTQVMYIHARGKFQSVDLNRKIDDFQYNHFYPLLVSLLGFLDFCVYKSRVVASKA